MYDKKLSDIYLENIHKQESYPASERDNYLLGLLREELKNIPEGKDSLIESYAEKENILGLIFQEFGHVEGWKFVYRDGKNWMP